MSYRLRTGLCGVLTAALTAATLDATPVAHAATAPAPLCVPGAGGGGISSTLSLDGWVNSPTTYDLAALQALPQTTVSDPFFAAGSQKFTGVALTDLLGIPAAGTLGSTIKADDPGPQGPTQKNDLTRFSIMVTGSDCFQALFSAAEISSWALATGAQKPLIAIAEGDESASGPATGPLGAGGSSGFARMIIPTDAKGSRRISNVVEVSVLKAPAVANSLNLGSPPTCGAGGPSTSLAVDGWVSAPAAYNAAGLQALPQTTVTDPFFAAGSRKFTGVALTDLLGIPAAGTLGSLISPDNPGPQAPSAQKNDLTRFAIMVTGSDCLQALFSAAEISSWALATGAQKPLIAIAEGDESASGPATGPLGTGGSSGFARMIIPTDAKGSRRISNVVEVRVVQAPTPQISWSPGASSTGSPLGPGQLDATAAANSAPVPGTFTYTPPAGTVLPPGPQTLTAFFLPQPGTSFTVARAAITITVTSTTLSISPQTPAGSGTTETLTATVAPTAAGNVQFVDGSTPVGNPAPVSNGTATLTTTLPPGTHALSAVFTPTDSTAFTASTSPTASFTVNAKGPRCSTASIRRCS